MERSGMKSNGMEWSGTEWNRDFIPLFGYFIKKNRINYNFLFHFYPYLKNIIKKKEAYTIIM
jgi:hypothetical protein